MNLVRGLLPDSPSHALVVSDPGERQAVHEAEHHLSDVLENLVNVTPAD